MYGAVPVQVSTNSRRNKEEIIRKVYAGKKYGILGNEKGVVVDFAYDNLRNVGSGQIPFCLAENFVDDADVYLVFYPDRNGKRLHHQMFGEKRCARIICE